MLAFLIVVTVIGAGACGGSGAPTSPTGASPEATPKPAAEVQTDVTLGVGHRTTVDALSLRFAGVAADSRCPADAFCIHLGEAVAVFEAALASRAASRLELRTTDAGRTGVVGDYRVELRSLEPYPFSSRAPIDPADYRATLRVASR